MGERTGTCKGEEGRSARKGASETVRGRPTRGQDAEVADRGWSVRADSSADTRSRTSITRRQASLV